MIAKKIKQYVSGDIKIWDKEKEKYRDANYGDIVILLRSPKSWTDKMAEVLKEEGIPAIASVQTGYFSALEVRTILNYLLIIDNPLQDIPLTGVLGSFIGNFTEKELGQIRECSQGETVYESLQYFIEKIEQLEKDEWSRNEFCEKEKIELKQKIQAFLKQLNELRELVPYTSVYDMIQQIYEKTGFYDYVMVLPGGSVRKGNLDMLLQKAIDFEATSYGGLFHFNRYIERLHEYDIDFGEAKNVDGNENVVQLMSIHKSKGLEFPIVFLAGMFKNFNKQDARSRLVLHPDLGIGPDYVDYKLRIKTPTLLKKVIQRQIELENLGEELRVLYVALTRAKEKLVLVGSGKDLDKLLEKWKFDTQMSYNKLTQAGNYGDWVGPRIVKQSLESDKKESLYSITLCSVDDLVIKKVSEEMSREEKKEILLNWKKNHFLNEKEKEAISSYINFVYRYKEEEKIKSKLSVSELKRMYQKEEEDLSVTLFEQQFLQGQVDFDEQTSLNEPVVLDRQMSLNEQTIFAREMPLEEQNILTKEMLLKQQAYIPDFAREEEIVTGIRRGNVYHKVMEALVFKEITGKESILQQLEKMKQTGFLSLEERKVVNIKKLTQFFSSNLGQRMIQADKKNLLFREQPFVIGVKAREVDNTIDSDELVLVQGIVDVYFKEGEELVLVDYKTDKVEIESQLVERYQMQLNYYKKALEQVTRKKVKESRIYSFYFEKEIVVD